MVEVRQIERRRTHRFKTALSLTGAFTAYLGTVGGTGEIYWTLPTLLSAPILYAVISLLGVED